MKGIQEVCQNALHDFNLCMFSQPADLATAGVPLGADSSPTNNHTGDEKPGHLSDEIVFKIIVICLAMIHIMQKDGGLTFSMCHLFHSYFSIPGTLITPALLKLTFILYSLIQYAPNVYNI